ncbi:MAG: Rne/Rng family ribonuclease [Candidatus Eremiobacteraeota bacterium]|nr:Rne/Rng family ribonuclease [Candidatus Eremiobacteraeota bacterium]
MSTEILISSDPWENRVAILEDGSLSEIYIEREEKVIGSIYKGKVQNVLPGMGASFVDIGLGRNAFLYVDDINKTPLNIGDVEITSGRSGWTISEKVNRGDDVLVQIVKEPRGLKGARISTNISLPGRYLILMPTGKYSGVSRKIDSADERNRLKAVMKRIRPEGMATVVRTAAGGVSEAELIADLGVLIRMWHGILETFKRAASPSLLHKDMNLVFKAARDFITADVDRVLIDDPEEYRKVREFLMLLGPQYLDRVEHYNSGRNLFKDYKVDEELQKLMRPKINLPSGGSIVIETTEALTVIDVNSGKFTGGKNLEDTIVKTNIEAAAEIARQVRLRDIGGIIVCDFIDMNTEGARNKVVSMLESVLRKDRTRATIQSFSALGLLEFTRKRVGKDLGAQLRGSCPTCNGLGSVLSPQSTAIETFRKIRQHHHTAGANSQPIVIDTFPTVAAQLEYWYDDECKELSAEIKTPIHVRVDALLHPERTKVHALAEGSKLLTPNLRVGDEHEVDILNTRLPNQTSAVTVLDNQLVEVENAANFAGQTIRIRIIDVDEDGALAEPLGVVATVTDAKKKRRRRGRKAPMTADEQSQQLLELAEEAAKGAAGRPVAIGISTEAEAEDEDAHDKTKVAAPVAIGVPPKSEAEATAISGPAQDGDGTHRKRRRRRRRRGHGDTPVFGSPQESASAQVDANEDDGDEDAPEIQTTPPAAPAAAGAPTFEPGSEAENEHRKRRRRRRRRGRGERPEGIAPMAASPTNPVHEAPAPPVPDRHIFRVNAEGSAEPTGKTAPREPSRSIAPWNRRPAPPAVEAPPPSLRVPEEPQKVTKPVRTRRATPQKAAPAAELQGSTMAALPSPQPEKKSTARPRKVAASPAASADEKPKRAKKAPAQSEGAEKPKPVARKSTAIARKKAPAAKTATTRKKK